MADESDARQDALAGALDAALPQTQCRRCGYADCRAYAETMASVAADVNRCSPGGAEGVMRLARIAARPARPLDAECGAEGPRKLAAIDEGRCIGCTLCIDACPVDAIFGAPKKMHAVIATDCTGCELCVPVCPVDCIELIDATSPRTGWEAWSAEQAALARARYAAHRQRLAQAARAPKRRRSGAAGPSVSTARDLVAAALRRSGRPD